MRHNVIVEFIMYRDVKYTGRLIKVLLGKLRQQKPIYIDYLEKWGAHAGSLRVYSSCDILDIILCDASHIRYLSFDEVCITVIGRRGYRNTVRGTTPQQAVNRALVEYQEHLHYMEDIDEMLIEYRERREEVSHAN